MEQGPKPMRNICILAPWEIKDWAERNLPPVCKNHRHIRKVEAMEMTGRGDVSPYARPIAEWAGPRQIRMIREYAWSALMTEGGTIGLCLLDDSHPKFRRR
jgi:hypothetical protein